jgi:tight adherence protein C
MGLAIFTFLAAFILISIAGSVAFFRGTTLRRLSKVVEAPATVNVLLDPPVAKPGEKIAKLIGPFQRIVPRSAGEVSIVQKRLTRAGYREKNYVSIFYGAKVLVPLLLCLLVVISGLYSAGGFFPCIMALGLGFLVPDFFLGNRIKARQTRIRLGLPDALDLIVICVEAGLGMDRAIMRTSEELQISRPEIADELGLVNLEQRAGRTRADAWKNIGDRTDVESVRALAAILIQADKFGTSVGKTLRSHAETLRTRRRQDAEEQAAKTTVKLIFPLVLCIFPALFVVTLGPSILLIMEQMKNFLN